MKVIQARNVHDALYLGLSDLQVEGHTSDSRNGRVLRFPEPVCTVYEQPLERVVFYPSRDANPYFHFFESLWMLAGRRDVQYVKQFNSNIGNYSDNGVDFHGAYGYRWRQWFDFDQLREITNALRNNHDDRRQVLSMWDAATDLGSQAGKKDLPCNLQAVFGVTPAGRLDMMVTNRSNDMIWGAYGANAVHFSYLHEFVAAAAGIPVGIYRQVSHNLHAYVDTDAYKKTLAILSNKGVNPYCESYSTLGHRVAPFPLCAGATAWEVVEQIEDWIQDSGTPQIGLCQFIRRVAQPMWESWKAFKNKENPQRFVEATEALRECKDTAWSLACWEWLYRRQVAQVKVENGS